MPTTQTGHVYTAQLLPPFVPAPPLSGRPVEAPFPVRDEAPLPGLARIPGAGISGQLHVTVRGPRLTKVRSIFLSGIRGRSWLTQ